MRFNSKLFKFKNNLLIIETTTKLSQNKKTQTISERLTLMWWKSPCIPMVLQLLQWQWWCKHDTVITQAGQIGSRTRTVTLVFKFAYKNTRKLK